MGTLALIASWVAAIALSRTLLRLAGEHRLAVALSFATLVMGVVPALVCRATGDMALAVLTTGAFAALGTFALRRPAARVLPPAQPRAPISRLAAAVALIGLGLVAWTAILNHFWDEDAAHFGVASLMARGVSPPEHPLFPGEPFRYHYAFDALAAQVRALTDLPVAYALDAVTIASFALLLVVAAEAGRTLAGASGRSLALVLVPLGAGTLQHLLFRDFGALEISASPFPARWQNDIPPPVISNFFQHPMGLAMPLTLAVLLMFERATLHSRRWLLPCVLGALAVGMLSLAHIVFFGVTGLSLGVLVLVQAARTRRFGRAATQLALLAGSFGLAIAIGGMLEPGGRHDEMITFARDFFDEPLGQRLLHHVVLFGLPLLALPFAFARIGKPPVRQVPAGQSPSQPPALGSASLRAALLAGAVVGFVIPNVMTYARSWDIVKFLGVAAFFANLLLADVLAAFTRPLSRLPRAAALAALVALSTSTSWIWLLRTSVLDGRLGVPKMHFTPPTPVARAVEERLSPLAEPRDRVLSTNVDLSKVGFLTPGFDWRHFGASYMMDRSRFEQLQARLQSARRHLRPADLAALDVRWVALSPGDVAALSPEGRAALSDPARLTLAFEVEAGGEKRQVYRVIR